MAVRANGVITRCKKSWLNKGEHIRRICLYTIKIIHVLLEKLHNNRDFPLPHAGT